MSDVIPRQHDNKNITVHFPIVVKIRKKLSQSVHNLTTYSCKGIFSHSSHQIRRGSLCFHHKVVLG